MHPLLRTLRVIGYSATNAYADFRASYTWTSWTFGWLTRMLSQVCFFGLVGQMLGSAAQTRYLVLGNGVMACVIEAMTVVVSTSWERGHGTLPLLAAAPGDLGWVMLGRSLQWPLSGSATAMVSLLAVGPAFGVHWPLASIPALLGLVLLTAVSTYSLGLFVGAFVLAAPDARNIVFNTSFLLLMAVCGAEVPVTFWPGWIQAAATALPPTHGLAAVRALADGAPGTAVAVPALWALLTGAGWLAAALGAFRVFTARARGTHAFGFAA
ncbi:ABC transporter permease [Streptomyces sp. ID05-04B]|uniref:ABC transporter permease n=1 Tax=unclassified Streptomyces TaxID=2593676 RepID=UPI000D229452|nr:MULTISPECIES: ABC transporter permease [unclassified Streptomyces]AVV44170.1 ABC transporter permease [Streptomyces sp. P3]MDX5569909.1 ABC transporter permease [Streptomyces sp. ID05-04B]